ncbi:hypothetical protein [Psychrobacter sp. I-STPA10]|uniref:hypothetical protein n=1 Tax=Psychrobacter sp. I-STPA10 TaxID=2585769 RepID=UPI001E576188|nr:hypothetical protein [Psychrobacter sp. I-STPA10]
MIRINIFLIIVLVGVVISGCKEEKQSIQAQDSATVEESKKNKQFYYIDGVNFSSKTDKEIGNKSVKLRSTVIMTQPVQPVSQAHINADAVQKARMIQESLSNTHAREAANFKDMCPKLLVKSVDSNKIARHGELLKDKYCDYYIYPFPNDRINVLSNGVALKRYIVEPIQHNFANGSYLVEKADKYIIRVKSEKMQQKPINYDIIITIEDEGQEDNSET